jgi:hypothetical protein
MYVYALAGRLDVRVRHGMICPGEKSQQRQRRTRFMVNRTHYHKTYDKRTDTQNQLSSA